MNKHFYSWNRIDDLVHKIAIDVYKAEYVPDYIVGIIRGGAIPGITLSHIMGKPFIPLDIRLRDNNTGTSLAQNFQNFFQELTEQLLDDSEAWVVFPWENQYEN